MSDEHKPHDDKGHNAGSAGDADRVPAVGHEDHSAPAAEAIAHDEPGHAAAAAPDEHVAPAPQEEPAPVAAQDASAHHDHSPVAAHDDPAPAVAHDDHGSDATAHNEPIADAHGHDDHGHDGAIPAAAPLAAGAAASTKAPIWSDSGDAPFEDVDTTPVYARDSGGKKRKSGGGSSSEGMEIFKTIFFALLIALVLRVLLFQPFTIPSASMEPNLSEGDYIVVSKWSYGYSKHSIPFSPPIFNGRIMLPMVSQEPQRGDIVVFKLPRDNETDYIKRLIGLPGDRIQMIDNVLFINGAALPNVEMSREDVQNLYGTQTVIQQRETLPEGRQINIQDWGPGSMSDNTPLFEVPAGHYFMIGDNRDNSQDSRFDQYSGVGYVPAENLIGKAEIILFSWTPGASLWNPVSWFRNIRPSRFFTVLD